MSKAYLLVVILLTGHYFSEAQYTRYIVGLKDKKGSPYSLSNPSAFLSTRSIARRTRFNIPIDSTDLPISLAYLDSLRNVPNVTVLNVSKWLNQVLIITTDPNAITKINSFPFVKGNASPIAPRMIVDQGNGNNKFQETVTPLRGNNPGNRLEKITSLNYGNSFSQIHIHEGEYLHDQGFTGQGIQVAVLDGGFFAYLTNPAFDSLRLQNRILGIKDYVSYDGSVNEDNIHGAYCLSILAANEPGTIVGSAPGASYFLIRTEDVNSEYPVEEQNWAAGAEFADSVGADMISTSLGYSDFDDPAFNQDYAQRNGHSTIVTIAANYAWKKGMIVTASAGNDGNLTTDYKYVACPADGDSVVAVGATDNAGNIAGFSSWGPNGAGKLKPNICSVGVGTVVANTNGAAATGSGTSFSNPNICGLIACLWQAFPEFNNSVIIDAVQKSSNKYSNPDNRYGYGLPNFHQAYDMLLKIRQANNPSLVLGNKFIKAYPVPFKNSFTVILKAPVTGKATIQLTNILGQIIDTREMDLQIGQVYFIDFPASIGLASGVYHVRYLDGTNKQTLSVIK